jgi:hypothetical protein
MPRKHRRTTIQAGTILARALLHKRLTTTSCWRAGERIRVEHWIVATVARDRKSLAAEVPLERIGKAT